MRYLTVFIFFFASFSAVSGVYLGSPGPHISRSCGVSSGSAFDPLKLSCKPVSYQGCSMEVLDIFAGRDVYKYRVEHCGRIKTYNLGWISNGECPAPSEMNDSTGICEEPPVCTENEKLNPDTNECEEIPFCNRDSTNDIIFDAEQRCAAKNGLFSFQCDNGDQLGIPEGLTTKCDDFDGCFPGMPGWPQCSSWNDDKDQVEDLPPIPSPNPDPINPSNPAPVTPPSGDDNGSNSDVINSLVSLNSDLNKGMASLSDEVKQNAALVAATNEAINAQTAQDAAISRIQQESIHNQTNKLVGSIGDLGKALQNMDTINQDKLASDINGNLQVSSCKSFKCTGSAASCYLAERDWQDRCTASENMQNLESRGSGLTDDLKSIVNDTFDEHGAIGGVYTTAKGDVSTLLSAYDETNGFHFDEGCPPPQIYNLGLVGTLQIDYTPFCDIALVFRFFIMASAALGSFFMIAKFM